VDLSEWLFAGLYGGSGVTLAKCKTLNLEVPADAEFILKEPLPLAKCCRMCPLVIHGLLRWRGRFSLIRFHCLTHRQNPIYLTTFSGRPPKEEAMMAMLVNRIYTLFCGNRYPKLLTFSCQWKH
jgi:4-hydroxy-3-polyprenylbenzoate decarboxylase